MRTELTGASRDADATRFPHNENRIQEQTRGKAGPTFLKMNQELELAKSRLTSITEQFNRPRKSKAEKADLIYQAKETRIEIMRLGGSGKDIQEATYRNAS